MADFQNAGYRLLSFKYIPPLAEKGPAAEEDKVGQSERAKSQPENQDLPSLSSLWASLQEIEGSDNAGTNKYLGKELQGEVQELVPTTTYPGEFHLFNDLPTELRLKIWALTFLPRVVELHPSRLKYSQGSLDVDGQAQWQSGCSNPAALAVSVEARQAALAHFRIPFPLGFIFTNPGTTTTNPFQSPTSTNTGLSSDVPSSTNDKGKAPPLLRRTLYLSPEHDTVCLLGQGLNQTEISHVMRTSRLVDPLDLGIARLGLSVRGWGYGGSAVLMAGLGTTVLRELDQLVLFMYGEYHPPPAWRAKGIAMEKGEEREQCRREGNRCELIQCEGGSACNAYKVWSGGKGRQFWDEDGNIMRIGRESNEIRILDLEFKAGF